MQIAFEIPLPWNPSSQKVIVLTFWLFKINIYQLIINLLLQFLLFLKNTLILTITIIPKPIITLLIQNHYLLFLLFIIIVFIMIPFFPFYVF